jgi:uncharacterized membrane protein YqjE
MPPETRPMSVGEWMITIIVLAIPLVNIIMYIYWAFSDSGNLNRRNFCRASLILFLVVGAIVLIISGIGSLFDAMLR